MTAKIIDLAARREIGGTEIVTRTLQQRIARAEKRGDWPTANRLLKQYLDLQRKISQEAECKRLAPDAEFKSSSSTTTPTKPRDLA